MLQMRTDRWYRYSARSMVVLVLVVMSGFFPAMAQAAQGSVDSYRYGYDWHDDDDKCVARYYVHRGDTLSRIAARYGVSVYAIARYNGIHNINRIYPGQYLCIPAHDGYHDWYDDEYRYLHDDDHGYHQKGDDGDYGHKRHDDDYGKHGGKHGYHDANYGYPDEAEGGYHEAAYGPVEEEYADPGYYRTSGGHTGVCYYPDPRYNADEAEFYEADERPDCS